MSGNTETPSEVAIGLMLPALIETIGSALCSAAKSDVRAVLVAIDINAASAQIAAFNLNTEQAAALLERAAALTGRGDDETVVRVDGVEVARYKGMPS